MADWPVSLIAQRLNQRALDVCGALGLRGERQGHEFVALNPTRDDRRIGSFRIEVAGPRAGHWKDFALDNAGGDALDLVGYVLGLDKGGAVQWAKDLLGVQAGSTPPKALAPTVDWERHAGEDLERSQRRKQNRAAQIFFEAEKSLKGTLAETYLACRGIDLGRLGRQPAALRYHPAVFCKEVERKLPAMVAAVTGGGGHIVSVHRTWLAVDGGQDRGVVTKANLVEAKKTLGRYKGGCIRLWRGASGKPMAAAPAGDTLAMTEGIEDALTVALIRPDWRIVSAVSVSNMANLELPPAIGTVVLCIDNVDGNPLAEAAVDRAVAAYAGQGRRVMIADPGPAKDFNALLQGG